MIIAAVVLLFSASKDMGTYSSFQDAEKSGEKSTCCGDIE